MPAYPKSSIEVYDLIKRYRYPERFYSVSNTYLHREKNIQMALKKLTLRNVFKMMFKNSHSYWSIHKQRPDYSKWSFRKHIAVWTKTMTLGNMKSRPVIAQVCLMGFTPMIVQNVERLLVMQNVMRLKVQWKQQLKISWAKLNVRTMQQTVIEKILSKWLFFEIITITTFFK